jgi:enoyl-[acyl-carrier protein] reductase/trans-2-enoyl-CoA reductase (NAD+)
MTIVRAKIRGFICTTAHPVGCARHVQEQIQYVKTQPLIKNGPKKVLIVGASNGYGLASRIAAAFGSRAATIGVFYERSAEGPRTATAGWYNSAAFERKAGEEGLYAKSINGDAFSDEVKEKVIKLIKADIGSIDCVIYSLASPRRVHPRTGVLYKSSLKPIGAPFTNKSIDLINDHLEEVTLPPATPQDVEHTVAVMGGEDWAMWIDALDKAGVLASGLKTVAYSYMGPKLTYAVYRNGTIGAAKEHLEQTAHILDQRLKKHKGRAFVSINKALVTQSSSAIPFIPLYFVILMKVMKEKGVHENCIQQIYRLFSQRLYDGKDVSVDEQGRIRIDDWEMRPDIQEEVQSLWKQIDNRNLYELADVKGYREDFLKLFGFGLSAVDYDADVDIGGSGSVSFL